MFYFTIWLAPFAGKMSCKEFSGLLLYNKFFIDLAYWSRQLDSFLFCKFMDLNSVSFHQLTKMNRAIFSHLDLTITQMSFFVSEPLVVIEEKAITTLANLCDGDARIALNGLQLAIQSQVAVVRQKTKGHDNEPNCPSSLQQNGECDLLDLSSTDTPGHDEKQIVCVNVSHIKEGLQKTHLLYDRNGEEHYNIISALHKSMRGSDENAALYWLARMLVGGEDPLFVARRLVRFASEDIGRCLVDLSCSTCSL